MTFLETIFERLRQADASAVLREVRGDQIVSVTGGEFLALIQQARQFFAARGLKKGDRCVLLAPNSIHWAAMDLAMMAEGLLVVPLYARQAPAELVAMMKDCAPARIFSSSAPLAAEIKNLWPAAPKVSMLDGVFTGDPAPLVPPGRMEASDGVTIIYTSGTSGQAKGVVLTSGNFAHMLACTGARLDQLMRGANPPDRIFHYLPFCFAGSRVLLLSALSRRSVLTLSTDLSKLSQELKLAAPDYFLNVPTLLERVRATIEEMLRKRGGFAGAVFSRAQRAYLRRHRREARATDAWWLLLAKAILFPAIRKSIGPNLKALICGSAPLAIETQLFFQMLGIPVLQVYGLTETTAICTMDDPQRVVPGCVGPAIPGTEMKLAENNEIIVRGPHIFSGYWQRPEETEQALMGGWFHTGDQGEVDAAGNWRITGRLKNLLILNSGHNIAPEPLEDSLLRELPEAQQIMLVGNQKSFLAALVTPGSSNGLTPERVQACIDAHNASLPHYKQVRAFRIVEEAFTIENGLLTANGKIKRDAVLARHAATIEDLYAKKGA